MSIFCGFLRIFANFCEYLFFCESMRVLRIFTNYVESLRIFPNLCEFFRIFAISNMPSRVFANIFLQFSEFLRFLSITKMLINQKIQSQKWKNRSTFLWSTFLWWAFFDARHFWDDIYSVLLNFTKKNVWLNLVLIGLAFNSTFN